MTINQQSILFGYQAGGKVLGFELEGNTLYFLNGRGRTNNMSLVMTEELERELKELFSAWRRNPCTVQLNAVFDIELGSHTPDAVGVAYITHTYDRGNGFIDGRTAGGKVYRWNSGQEGVTPDVLSTTAEILRDLAATLDEHG